MLLILFVDTRHERVKVVFSRFLGTNIKDIFLYIFCTILPNFIYEIGSNSSCIKNVGNIHFLFGIQILRMENFLKN